MAEKKEEKRKENKRWKTSKNWVIYVTKREQQKKGKYLSQKEQQYCCWSEPQQ